LSAHDGPPRQGLRVFILAALAILVLDTAGSFASREMGFSYSALIPVSLLIQATAGFFAARAANLKTAVAVGSGVAAIEATLGWAISWAIGPGRPPGGHPGIAMLTVAALIVVIMGAFFGFIGGGIARLLARIPSSWRAR
jgi:hypothetical protein